jgi:plasmid replication initiation protein
MKEKSTRKYTDSEVATQHNKLINSQQSLSLVQKRIFYLAIKQIRKGDKDYKRYYVDLSDLAPGTSQDVYHRVSKELDELMNKTIKFVEEINGERYDTRLNLISKAQHKQGTGQLYVDMHPDIRDMLLELKGYFTKVPVMELVSCRSTYGQRLYELLYQFADTGIRLMSVEELRAKLNLQNKYKNFAHFRINVLKKAQKDVEKHTNMSFTWDEIKARKGRKIERLIFDIKVSDPKQTEMDFSAPKVDMSKHKNLQASLRDICQFSDENVKKVLRHLEEFPDDKPVFHGLIHKTELRIRDGQSDNASQINDPEAWALKLFKKAMQSAGSYKSDESPLNDNQIDPEQFDKDAPEYDPKNPFNEMRPN